MLVGLGSLILRKEIRVRIAAGALLQRSHKLRAVARVQTLLLYTRARLLASPLRTRQKFGLRQSRRQLTRLLVLEHALIFSLFW